MTWSAVAGLASNTFTDAQILPGGSESAPTLRFTTQASNTGLSAAGATNLDYGVAGTTSVTLGSGFIWVRSNTADYAMGGSADARIGRAGAATIRLGESDAASPVAQTLQVQSVVAGTSNTAGVAWTISGSKGTGSGVGGNILFKVAPAGGSGTSQNSLSTALTLDATNSLVTGGFAIKGGAGFQSSDGTAGASATVVVKGSDGNNCNLVFKSGLYTSTTCP